MDDQDNAERLQKLARLNDDFRCTLLGRRMLMTAGVAALERRQRLRVMEVIENYSSFTVENDPNGEHDLGFFRIEDQAFFWRIEYYDPTFPQRISLGGRTVGFIESEIEIWLVARMAARTGTK